MQTKGVLVGVAVWIATCGLGLARADEEPKWTQIESVITYERTGTSATAKTGTFTFTLQATVNQVMMRLAPGEGEKWPSYVTTEDYSKSGKVSGKASLSADAPLDQYHAAADLQGTLTTLDHLSITSIRSASPLGEGLLAELAVNARLKGAVTSTLPRMPDTVVEDSVLLWPTPVAFDQTEGLRAAGTITLLPELGSAPQDEALAQTYAMLKVAYDFDDLPGLGGIKPPTHPATTEGTGDKWTLRLKREKTFETGTGGTYTDRFTVVIRPVPLTLPKPKAVPQS